MNLIRLILLGLAIAIAWHFIKRRLHRSDDSPTIPHQGDMVRCQHCGLFLPRENALQRDGRYYCSAAHREADGDS